VEGRSVVKRYEYDGLIAAAMHERGCFAFAPEECEDIFQELRIVVEKCKKKWDASLNVAFSTYATTAIHNRVTRLKSQYLKRFKPALFSQIAVDASRNVEDEIIDESYDIDRVVAKALLASEMRSQLRDVERDILRLMFLGFTLRQVAARVHLDRQTVWKKANRAKARIRAPF
jgi:RNA polymerase sigma factor (sigma-70 family)